MDIRSESLLAGRKGLVVGIANEHSIAHGCARVVRACAPLRRAVEIDDVGWLCAFLVSDAAQAITGDVHYVDGGYHILA